MCRDITLEHRGLKDSGTGVALTPIPGKRGTDLQLSQRHQDTCGDGQPPAPAPRADQSAEATAACPENEGSALWELGNARLCQPFKRKR